VVIDYDNDGLLDLYFANGASLATGGALAGNALTETTGRNTCRCYKAAGHECGFPVRACGWNYDNDRFLDLYVTGYGSTSLSQQWQRTFTDVTAGRSQPGG
jgi:hypothetical protein